MPKIASRALIEYDQSRNRLLSDPRLVLNYAKCSLNLNRHDAAINILKALPQSDSKANFAAGTLLGQAADYPTLPGTLRFTAPGYPSRTRRDTTKR